MSPPSDQGDSGTRPALLVRITSPTGLAGAVLVGITLAFYSELWRPGLVLIKRDAFRFFLPLKQYLIERLWDGDLPQWFPYEALGRPFIGVTHTGVFHPFTALYFLLPVPDAYRASTLLSCLLAALGAFALGRTLSMSRTGSLIAGASFVLSGYVVSLTDNLLYLYSVCALPLFCATLERALKNGGAWTVAAAAVWATVFLNGDVQTGYYFGFIALLWTLARAPGLYRKSLRLALVLCLAGLLAGIQLGPAWEVFIVSERAHPALFHSQSLDLSTHPLRLVTVLASPIGATVDPAALARFFFGTFKAGFWSESLYLGVPVVGLAFLGAWRRRDLRVLALLGTLALVLALGRHGGLYELFYQVVPLWSAFRYPEKFMGVVSFAVAMLAGAGLDALRAGNGRSTLWFLTALLCMTAGLGLHTEAASTWTAAHFGTPEDLALDVTGSAGLAFLYSAVAALGMWLIALGTQRGWLREWMLPLALAALITLDLARANFGAYHTGPVEAATFLPPLTEAIAAREGGLVPGRFRLISMRHATFVAPESIRRLLGHEASSVEARQALALDHNAQFHIEAVYYYLPGLKAKLPPIVGTDVAARFNVVYYIGRRSPLKETRLAKSLVAFLPPYDLALFQNPVPAKPRAYLSRRPERAAAQVDPAVLFARPDFLSGEVDVIETTEETLPGPSLDGVAAIEHYAPEDVRVRVETPQPAVLILLDAYDQGWTATLEGGAELPILRANALVRAVVVPAGTHVVTFSYQTPLLKAGAWASLTGVLACIGLIAHARRQRHCAREHT